MDMKISIYRHRMHIYIYVHIRIHEWEPEWNMLLKKTCELLTL